jgi:hypothetical protein
MSCCTEQSEGSLDLSSAYQLNNGDLEVSNPLIRAGLANAAQDDKAVSPQQARSFP